MTSYQPLDIPAYGHAESAYGFAPCDGGVCAAAGIRAAGFSAGFRRNPNRRDLALVVADETCVCAGTFTKNRFCAAPVQVSRERAAAGRARAVVLNSGNANAATGDEGLEVARTSARLVAEAVGCSEEEVLVASTGVIGVPLGLDNFRTGVPACVAQLDRSAAAAHHAARAVMTTDTHSKQAAVVGQLPGRDGTPGTTIHVGGFCKGSGMIQPNMATMLAVLSTDASLTAAACRPALVGQAHLQQGDGGLRHLHQRHLRPAGHRQGRRRPHRRGVSRLPGGRRCRAGGVRVAGPPDCG